MNKQKFLNILQCFFIAVIACVAIIFVIKYTFEIKLSDNNSSTEATTKSDTIIGDETSSAIEAIEIPKDEDIPLEEREYEVNGIIYYNDDLLKPCESYNNSIIYNNAKYMKNVYPDVVIDYLIKQSDYESVEAYVNNLFLSYQTIFDSDFVFNNTLLDTTVLTDDELKDMNSFFSHVFNTEFNIEYAVLMKTVCSITYFDTKTLSELNTDSETEYFVSYYYDGKWYIDYLYTDYYFFN